MDEYKQLSCPFYGSENISSGEILFTDIAGESVTQSMCEDFGALGPGACLATDEVDYGDVKAIAAWNRRAPSIPQPQSLLSDEEIKDVMCKTTLRGFVSSFDMVTIARAIESKVRQQDEEVRRDAERLMFSFEADGFGCIEKDKYDFAIEVAAENMREVPTKEDELNGVRRLIDAAIAKIKGE
jgi:hypothetical protein